MTRKPWGVYRKNAGDAPFHVCFCAFAGEDDGVLVETFPARPEALSAALRSRPLPPEVEAADPLTERCTFCGALPGEHCYACDRLIGERWGFRKPHAASAAKGGAE